MKQKIMVSLISAATFSFMVGCSTHQEKVIQDVAEPIVEKIMYDSCSESETFNQCKIDDGEVMVKLTDTSLLEKTSTSIVYMDKYGLQAKMHCLGKGEAWRLPSYEELQLAISNNHQNQFNFSNDQYWSNEYVSKETPINIDVISVNGMTGDALATHGVQNHLVKCVMDIH